MHRIEWIDIAKGLGLIFLIYGHIANNLFTQWIYTFHSPLFFFLSGFLFSSRKNFNDFLISKTNSLLIPYLFLGIPMIIPNLKYFDLPYLLKCFVIPRADVPPLVYQCTLYSTPSCILYHTFYQTKEISGPCRWYTCNRWNLILETWREITSVEF